MPITPTSSVSKNYQALGIDEIANDIETAFNAINQLEAGGGSDYTETIVNISSAQILAMDPFTKQQLLPAISVGQYYDGYMTLEFTEGNVIYSAGSNLGIYQGGTYIVNPIESFFLNSGDGNRVLTINLNEGISYDDTGIIVKGLAAPNLGGEAITLGVTGASFTLGNGTLRVKIYHKTITFGA